MKEEQIRSVNDIEGEIWKEIPGYNGLYLISNYSRIKSLVKAREIILKKTISSGKFKVMLIGSRNRRINESVGRLVGTMFIREPNENEIIEYKDGNRLNDKADNLKWGTRSERSKKSLLKEKLSHKGASNGMAVLTEEKVREIRNLKLSGRTYSKIAKEFNVSISCVQHVVERRCWKTV